MPKIVESINTSLLLVIRSIMAGVSGAIDKAISATPSTDKTKTMVLILHTALFETEKIMGHTGDDVISAALVLVVARVTAKGRTSPFRCEGWKVGAHLPFAIGLVGRKAVLRLDHGALGLR
jgi:hypothetical protein